MLKPVWDSKTSQNFNSNFDCYIAEALLCEGRSFRNEAETIKKYKVSSLQQLAIKQEELLNQFPQLLRLFSQIEMPLARVLYHMEQRGILLDTAHLKHVGQQIEGLILELEEKINKETGGGVNINSPIQLGHFLVEKVGVPLGRTKTGKYATNEGELSLYKDQFPIISLLLSYRELTKLRSTYVESLITKVDGQSRVHTTYNQVYVNTGRLASSNPNLQNIPVSSPIGLEIKSCFVASPGMKLVSFDYSQQELRVLAHLAGEKELIKAFQNNQDVHTLTASKLFNIPYENISKQQRAVGKTINFGIIYGMSSYGMSTGLHISETDAAQFIKNFYTSYPSIKTYYDEYLKNAKINGVVETLLGRRRYVFDFPGQRFISNNMRRVLMNYPIQGSAADLMKKAMVEVQEKVLNNHPEIYLLLQIHDDLVFEIPDKDEAKLNQLIEEIKKSLCLVYPLAVPLVVDVKIGKKWGELESVK